MTTALKRHREGFTLVELIVTMGIIAVMLTLGGISFLGGQRRSVLSSTVETIVSDLKQQQLKAVTGDTGGASYSGAYGIYFEPSRYTLFHGTQYQLGNADNFVVNLNSSIQFIGINFPSSTLVFASVSGETLNYISGSDNLTVEEVNNKEQNRIIVNGLGSISIQ